MPWKTTTIFIAFLVWTSLLPSLSAQTFVTAHFLYGSKPAKGFEKTESKWFGGLRGGHVGLEILPHHVLNFMPSGKFHWLANARKRHSRFADLTIAETYGSLGGSEGKLKTLSIRIPVDSAQFSKLTTISESYTQATPYDYAFLGMRCAAATDEILSRIGITKPQRLTRIALRTFRPRALRRKLLHKAEVYGWKVSRQDGSNHRVWEKE